MKAKITCSIRLMNSYAALNKVVYIAFEALALPFIEEKVVRIIQFCRYLKAEC